MIKEKKDAEESLFNKIENEDVIYSIQSGLKPLFGRILDNPTEEAIVLFTEILQNYRKTKAYIEGDKSEFVTEL